MSSPSIRALLGNVTMSDLRALADWIDQQQPEGAESFASVQRQHDLADRLIDAGEAIVAQKNGLLKPPSIEEATAIAIEAFFAIISELYPSAKYGDFPPDATFQFEAAAATAARVWIEGNVPEYRRESADVTAVVDAIIDAQPRGHLTFVRNDPTLRGAGEPRFTDTIIADYTLYIAGESTENSYYEMRPCKLGIARFGVAIGTDEPVYETEREVQRPLLRWFYGETPQEFLTNVTVRCPNAHTFQLAGHERLRDLECPTCTATWSLQPGDIVPPANAAPPASIEGVFYDAAIDGDRILPRDGALLCSETTCALLATKRDGEGYPWCTGHSENGGPAGV